MLQQAGLGGVTPAASDYTAGLILNKNESIKGFNYHFIVYLLNSMLIGVEQIDS